MVAALVCDWHKEGTVDELAGDPQVSGRAHLPRRDFLQQRINCGPRADAYRDLILRTRGRGIWASTQVGWLADGKSGMAPLVSEFG